MINGRGCRCKSVNLVLRKVVRQYILAVRTVVIQAGLLLLGWKAVPFQQPAVWILTPSSSEWKKKKKRHQPPCLAGKSAFLQPDKYSRLDSLSSSTEMLVAICQLFALTHSHRCPSTRFFRGDNTRSGGNQVICSTAPRSIRQTERGRSQGWKLPYVPNLSCKRY